MIERFNNSDAHGLLHRALTAQQELLIAGEFPHARTTGEALRALLQEHMAFEEDFVLPLYARVSERRWPLELFTGQHQKLLLLLSRAEQRLLEIERSQPEWRRGVIEVIE